MNIERISSYATLLGLAEMGLGSFLHALKIPFSGTLLCANQIFLLSRASLEGSKRFETGAISCIAALLKSCAPIGKKITPMIALFLQGALFNSALLLFGNNRLGRMAGGLFAMLSSICQPLFFYYLLYGQLFIETLVTGSQTFSKELNLSEDSLLYAFAFFTSLKLILGIFSAYAASQLSEETVHRYLKKIAKPAKSSSSFIGNPLKGAFKDIIKPFFLFTALATGLFLFWKEKDYMTLLQHMMRTFGLGFLCFYLVRSLPVERIISRWTQKGSSPFLAAWKKTLTQIQSPLLDLPRVSIPAESESHSGQT